MTVTHGILRWQRLAKGESYASSCGRYRISRRVLYEAERPRPSWVWTGPAEKLDYARSLSRAMQAANSHAKAKR